MWLETYGNRLSIKLFSDVSTPQGRTPLFHSYDLVLRVAADTYAPFSCRSSRWLALPLGTICRKQQVNSTGFDADDSIPLQRRLEEVSLATLSEAPHK